MASTAPAKSQPLHNFDLPHLKWNKDGNSTGNHQRRRSTNSPSRRPNLSPLRQSPLRDSVSATTPYRQSPLRDTPPPPPPPQEYSVKQSPIRGESSSKWTRQSPIGGESVLKHSPVLVKRDSAAASESENSGRSKGSVIGFRKNHSKRNTDFDGFRGGEVNSTEVGTEKIGKKANVSEVNSLNSEVVTEKIGKKSKVSEVDGAGIKRSSKILIKIPCKSKPEEESVVEDAVKVDGSDEVNEADQVQEEGKNNNNISIDEEAKTWNLRPRKPLCKNMSLGGAGLKNNGLTMPESSRNVNNKTGEKEGNGEKEKEKEKRKLSINIALTKEEIEEDFYGWTGSKPPRRPKKRPKNIQKQLDFVFPGLWLVSITPDSYKVSESYMKS